MHAESSRLGIGRQCHAELMPYHHKAFRDRRYSFVFPGESRIRHFWASVVVKSHTKHPYMQICIGYDEETDSPQYLFFGEEYGFPTAFWSEEKIKILYGDSDWLDHHKVYSSCSSTLKAIANRVRYQIGFLHSQACCLKRHVCLGATNSLGHSLINDLNGAICLAHLIEQSKASSEFCISGNILFDVLAFERISKMHAIPKGPLAIVSLGMMDSFEIPFFVRAFGYGFRDQERHSLGLPHVTSSGIPDSRKNLWISIRSPKEERHNPFIYDLTLRLLCKLAGSYERPVIYIDGMTKISLQDNDSDEAMLEHVAQQNLVASELATKIYQQLPDANVRFLIGRDLAYKISIADQVTHWIGPYGSGSWPIWIMQRGTAHVIVQQELSGLKSEPTFDYISQWHNVSVLPIRVNPC